MTQSRLMSLIESFTNMIVGYVLALVTQLVVLPFYGVHLSMTQNISIVSIFTVVSLVRSYCIRRIFNKLR